MAPTTPFDGASNNNNETCAEDALQSLLSTLSELGDFLLSQQHQDTSLPTRIWKILTGKETSLVNSSDAGMKEAEKDSNIQRRKEWEEGLILASRLVERLSPTELHSTTTSCVVFGRTRDSTAATDNHVFLTTCILLCCIALQQCPDTIEKRWKRWQSLQLETIRLYQQYYCGGGGTYDVDLWCQHVLPAAANLQKKLLSSNTSGAIPSSSSSSSSSPLRIPRWMAFEAGTVQCAARLAEQQVMQWSTNQSDIIDFTSSCEQLYTSLAQHVFRGRYEILYEHPWRKQMQQQNYKEHRNNKEKHQTEAAALAFYTLPILVDSQDDDEGDDRNEEDRKEQVMGMKTEWPDVGVALLVAAAARTTVRPGVWDAKYLWRLSFPHVGTLLLGLPMADGDNKSDDDDMDDVEFDSRTNENKMDYRNALVMAQGFRLLQELLKTLPDRSLSAVVVMVNKDGAPSPDCPIGTCQLLANQIVASSSALETSSSRSVKMTLLPSAAQAYQLLKCLVSKYVPDYQVRIVKNMIDSCPYAGLQPKIVDILRSFVTWNDASAERQVWLWLETKFLSALERHTSSVEKGNTLLVNVDELLANVEVYGAVLGLVQLWIMCKREVPADLLDFDSTLKTIHAATKSSLDAWSRPGSLSIPVPTEHHRLNLLESVLAQTIELIEGL